MTCGTFRLVWKKYRVFQNTVLKNHIESSFTIKSRSAVVAEWNMNVPGNILKLGNYRYRASGTQYNALPNIFDILDSGNNYTGATDSDIKIASGVEEDEVTPLLFAYPKEKEKMYYSLEDCIKPFRPRSGINKLSYFRGNSIPHVNKDMFRRPRYYMSHKDDEFKYWRSVRTESTGETVNSSNIEYGFSEQNSLGIYPITDANPFVVYKQSVPANRLVVKVQTNVGDIDLGPFTNEKSASYSDPFYGDSNKTVPQIFSIEYLDENSMWQTAYSFNSTSLRSNGSPIFGTDGYLGLEYGLEIPVLYKDNFVFVGTIGSADNLPDESMLGYAYLVGSSTSEKGIFYIYNGSGYTQFEAKYAWSIGSDGIIESTNLVTDLTSPSYFIPAGHSTKVFREFVWVKGMRLVVKSMSKANASLDLIELSPRLEVDMSSRTIDFDITKNLADLSSSSLPVGQLLASVGKLSIHDDDQSFNINNAWNGTTGSILAEYVQKNIKFVFYEVIKDVGGDNYYVPLKTLYSEGIPQVDNTTGTVSIELRDMFFYFESLKSPEVFLTNVSLSQAICILLDSVGFSNYSFKRLSTESDPIIPFFFVSPDEKITDTLSNIAMSTQSAMFFDEYNNFIVMTKGYLLDSTNERSIDMTLYGSRDPVDSGVIENLSTAPLPNIIEISSEDRKVYNDGSINYTARYIQRSYGSFKQSQLNDSERMWVYKPVLLWEVAGTEAYKSLNSETQSKYALGALPLNSDLSSQVPTVVSRQLTNNFLDFGENVYFVTRPQGYLYSGGEIIKYDAVQYSVTIPVWYKKTDLSTPIIFNASDTPSEEYVRGSSNVWISSGLEYQKFFSKLPFNGKMYPTGLVRIYSKPFYETIDGITKMKNGAVVEHGRGQFNTPVVSHGGGVPSYWSDNNNVRGCDMQSQYLYTTDLSPTLPAVTSGEAGVSNARATKSQRNGVIKNFLSSGWSTETGIGLIKTAQTGTVQASALVINGPDFEPTDVPRNFVTYVHKAMDKAYKHFGTRLRIVGKIESAGDRSQSPVGGMTYFNIPGLDPTQTISIGGGSAGISLVNPETNMGYYFEIAALTTENIQSYLKNNQDGEAQIALDNIMFYKVQKDNTNFNAIPTKLWGANGNIIVDDGNFAGQYRFVGEENPTVYDLAIEYVDTSATTRDFYLYINQKLVRVVTDTSPMPLVNSSVGLFVRGTSKAMFENVYALSKNYGQDTPNNLNTPISDIFSNKDSEMNTAKALSKYAISGAIQNTYLTGISPSNTRQYDIYFEEFGSIMRECAYFNIKYDRAYPALYAKIAPTINKIRGYSVSGFLPSAYGAEFLIFNNTDTLLSLDETTGNYLRILGVTFTQDTTGVLTVDDYFKKIGTLSDPELKGDTVIYSPQKATEEYDIIKRSRLLYGKNEFTVSAPFIQDQDSAQDLMGWIINKNLKPRKSVGINLFATPTLQLGDVVNINYKNDDGIDMVSPTTTRFVVYSINYSRTSDGPNMTIYLSEV